MLLCLVSDCDASTPIPFLLSYCFADPRHLHSFPTRRSSDLCVARALTILALCCAIGLHWMTLQSVAWTTMLIERSEEHTSELQSRFDLVCRLLLEKKKPAAGRRSMHRRSPP